PPQSYREWESQKGTEMALRVSIEEGGYGGDSGQDLAGNRRRSDAARGRKGAQTQGSQDRDRRGRRHGSGDDAPASRSGEGLEASLQGQLRRSSGRRPQGRDGTGGWIGIDDRGAPYDHRLSRWPAGLRGSGGSDRHGKPRSDPGPGPAHAHGASGVAVSA